MEKLSPERVKLMLSKKGAEVTLEEATMILSFLRKMANIVVASYLETMLEKGNVK